MKNRNWVSLVENENNVKKAERKFVELNGGTSDANQNDLKTKIIESTLWDSFINHKKLMCEAVKNNPNTNHEFFKRDEWTEFEKHGEMIAQYMNADEDQIKQAIKNMKTAFATLGGGDSEELLSRGLEKLQELDAIFEKAGIKSLEPKIRTSKFIELLSQDYKTKKNGKVVQMTRSNPYDMKMFIDMIFDRSNHKFIDYIDKPDITIGKILDHMFSEFKGDKNEAYNIFRKIITQNSYSKNNANVGKAEIALALFFGDCRLPDDNGDIALEVWGQSRKIELKGQDGIITERIQLYQFLNGSGNKYWSDHKNGDKSLYPKELNTDAKLWKWLNKDENRIDIDSDECITQLESVVQKLRSMTKDPNHMNGLVYKVLFSALFSKYTRHVDDIVIINTDDDLGKESITKDGIANIAIMTTPIVVLRPRHDSNWLNNGLVALSDLTNKNVVVKFEQAHDKGQGGFKVRIKGRKSS